MSVYLFPAVFDWSDEDKTYYVTFPDLENCFTDGDDIQTAMANASDVLNLMIWVMERDGDDIPKPREITDVKAPAGGFVNLVLADTEAYREMMERLNNPIRLAREKAGMTIKQVAELLEAPYRTVQEWNAGRRMPPKWIQRLIVEKIETAIA